MVPVFKKLKILLRRWNIADKIYKTTKWQIDIRINKNILKEIRRELWFGARALGWDKLLANFEKGIKYCSHLTKSPPGMFCYSCARFYSLFTSSHFLPLFILRASLPSGVLQLTALVFALKWRVTETWSLLSWVALRLCSSRATLHCRRAKGVSNPNLAVLLHTL